MVKYYQVDSEETGKEVSELIYRIMSPSETDVKYLFVYGTDLNGVSYIEIPVDVQCPIFINGAVGVILSELSKFLKIEEQEGNKIADKLRTGVVTLGEIIPSSLVEFYPVLKLNETPPFGKLNTKT